MVAWRTAEASVIASDDYYDHGATYLKYTLNVLQKAIDIGDSSGLRI